MLINLACVKKTDPRCDFQRSLVGAAESSRYLIFIAWFPDLSAAGVANTQQFSTSVGSERLTDPHDHFLPNFGWKQSEAFAVEAGNNVFS